MTIDPYYDALRKAQAEAEAKHGGELMPQAVPDPGYVSPQIVPLEDVVDGPEGKVRVRVYRPEGVELDGSVPLIMWWHRRVRRVPAPRARGT